MTRQLFGLGMCDYLETVKSRLVNQPDLIAIYITELAEQRFHVYKNVIHHLLNQLHSVCKPAAYAINSTLLQLPFLTGRSKLVQQMIS